MQEEEQRIPEGGEERTLLKEFLAQGGAPAFVVRAQRVEMEWETVLSRCRQQREEWLAMVRVRLGVLAALAGEWETLLPWLGELQLEEVRRLFQELQPKL